mmetsp:Transcript_2390/g.4235  ORF Transcript_2390/g.4235 Transcript_2390/m.4235 type:complete len:805 (+) Transcript_2390:51-2465(+)
MCGRIWLLLLVMAATLSASVGFRLNQRHSHGWIQRPAHCLQNRLFPRDTFALHAALEEKEYGSESITVLKGLEPVRKRPGMYIGSTGPKGLHHLVFEVVDNSVDESLAGHCTEIFVTLNRDGSVTVRDNGRGIPCAPHPSTGKSTLETVLCVLHAGGKFGGDASGYKVSGGLHGVGLSVVNALSDELTVEVVRDETYHTMQFCRGIPMSDIETRPASISSSDVAGEGEQQGTRVTFKPDGSIFKTTTIFEFDKLAGRLDELAYLNAGLTIHLIDKRPKRTRSSSTASSTSDDDAGDENESSSSGNNDNDSEDEDEDEEDLAQLEASSGDSGSSAMVPTRHDTYRHDGGISELVQVLCEGKSPLFGGDSSDDNADDGTGSIHEDKTTKGKKSKKTTQSEVDIISVQEERKGVSVEVAMRWSKDHYVDSLQGFANGIRTGDGGSHLDGLKAAVTKTVNSVAKKTGKLKDVSIPGEFIREGLTAVVSVKVPEPEFEGQTKTRLGNPEVRQIVDGVVSDALQTLFEWHPHVFNAICSKALAAQAASVAAKAAREMVRRKSLLTSTVLPGKLADCASRNPAEGEIYIVEGDSAAGSAKLGRDRRTQAILPLRGKILNIEKATADRIYQNTELQALISALGLGVKGVVFDKESLRYHRIVIMTDADVDGAHIRLLLLTFFYRYQRDLLLNGFVYIACPPLYKVSRKGKGKASNDLYFYDQPSMDEYMSGLSDKGSSSLQVQRFKGLGEMMPTQLWDTTMNPETRVLKSVSIEDAAAADRLFTMLMGDNVQPRKEFIISNVDQMQLTDLDY